MQSPILVNRGWVPRSWRDKSREVLQNDELPSTVGRSSVKDQGSSWWRFWSKKPKIIEVIYITTDCCANLDMELEHVI